MEEIRSFIAIELPDGLKQELNHLEAQLKKSGPPGVKWVNPDSIHLTLKFLGNIAQNQIDEITKAMEEAVQGIPPFHLEIKDLGVFPNLKRVQVAWVGISGDVNKLSLLQQNIESKLARLGFTPESRPFTAHLTLARVQNRASLDEQQKLGQIIASTRFEAIHSIEVNAISLMRSQLTRQGAIYNQISSVKLKKPLPTTNA